MQESKYVITRYKDGLLSYTINLLANRLESINYIKASPEGGHIDEAVPGNISVGDIFSVKVSNVNECIHAAFIDYSIDNGKTKHKGYLPLEKHSAPFVTNRSYDGRIIAGDEIIVQLEREAVRSKEPVFTTSLSISGKYSVVTTAFSGKKVSGKCSPAEKEQLLGIIPTDIPYGVIARTNARDIIEQPDVIAGECRGLSDKLGSIIKYGKHRTCCRLYQAPPLYLSELRDTSDLEAAQIMTDDLDVYNTLRESLAVFSPSLLPKLYLYEDDSYQIIKLHGIESKISELLGKRVWLDSGAYIVIEKTEAMYVIDVNSGKKIKGKQSEDYILSINCEAAREIMRQIKLRSLSGIIMVDFINMKSSENNERLMSELEMLAKQDRVETRIVDMTKLGLVEITRKRVRSTFAEQLGV